MAPRRRRRVVEATAEARDQARERAEGLRERDRVRRRLEDIADRLDALVQDLVTSESGPISLAEEKLRENLAALYSNVINYAGRPGPASVPR